jgi:hypothetical protein
VLEQTDIPVSFLHGHPLDRRAHLRLSAGLQDRVRVAAGWVMGRSCGGVADCSIALPAPAATPGRWHPGTRVSARARLKPSERSSDRWPAVNAKVSSASARSSSRSSRTTLGDWYSGELRSKLARAVMSGRVDAAQVARLHRLMTELVDVDLRRATGAERSWRVDGETSR